MLVEDDEEMRSSLQWMLNAEGIKVSSYATPAELLNDFDPEQPGCLVLDLKLPGMSGMALREQLVHRGCYHPFIIITGHGNVTNAVNAMRQGAVHFLQKPFDHDSLLNCVKEAFAKDEQSRKEKAALNELEVLMSSLTRREREVLELVVDGRLTKQIANDLGISSKTVEVHRSNITKKFGVESVAQLVQMVAQYRAAKQAGNQLHTSSPGSEDDA